MFCPSLFGAIAQVGKSLCTGARLAKITAGQIISSACCSGSPADTVIKFGSKTLQ